MSASPNNERRACDAVALCLEELCAAQRSDESSPEDQHLEAPIEYVFELAGTMYAFEHTLVEAFPKQTEVDVRFEEFIAPLQSALDRNLPRPGLFRMLFPLDPTKGMKPRRVQRFRDGVIAWAHSSATDMHAEQPDQPTREASISGRRDSRRVTIEGVEVVLERDNGWYIVEAWQGRLFPGRVVTHAVEPLRQERLQETLRRKLPKLHQWKLRNARTVLVLEDRDLPLSNHVLILEALESALLDRNDHPDEVWLVETLFDDRWTVRCLIRDRVAIPDEHTSTRFRQFARSDLRPVP